jgi:hypothetical protein
MTLLFCHNLLKIALNVYAAYCDKWKLVLNTSKTKVMVFARGRQFNTISLIIMKISKLLMNINILELSLVGEDLF